MDDCRRYFSQESLSCTAKVRTALPLAACPFQQMCEFTTA